MIRLKGFGLFALAFYLTALGHVFHARGMVAASAALSLAAFALMGRLVLLARQA